MFSKKFFFYMFSLLFVWNETNSTTCCNNNNMCKDSSQVYAKSHKCQTVCATETEWYKTYNNVCNSTTQKKFFLSRHSRPLVGKSGALLRANSHACSSIIEKERKVIKKFRKKLGKAWNAAEFEGKILCRLQKWENFLNIIQFVADCHRF